MMCCGPGISKAACWDPNGLRVQGAGQKVEGRMTREDVWARARGRACVGEAIRNDLQEDHVRGRATGDESPGEAHRGGATGGGCHELQVELWTKGGEEEHVEGGATGEEL